MKATPRHTTPYFSDLTVCFISFSSFLFGWALACFNTLRKQVILSFLWCGDQRTYDCPAATEYFSNGMTILFCGAATGALTGGVLLKYGRRLALAANFCTYVVGSVVCGIALAVPHISVFYIGRFLVGLAVGLTTVAVPTYISEITPPKVRGARGVINQLMITVGIFTGTAIGYAVPTIPAVPHKHFSLPAYDRYFVKLSLLLPAAVGLLGLMLQGIYFVYDTPTYYVSIDETSKAARVLQKIYNKVDIEDELKDCVLQNEESKAMDSSEGSSFSIFKSPQIWSYVWVIFLGCIFSAGQQLTGINVFVTLSSQLFESAGLQPDHVTTACTAVALVNTVMTFPAMAVDKFGRRTMLLSMVIGQTLALAMYPLSAVFTSDLGTLSIVAIVSVICYIMCFAMGYGPILAIYLPEMFPPEIRPQGCALSLFVNWIAATSIVGFGSHQTNNLIQFTVFAGMGALFSLCIFLFMKETKNSIHSPYVPPRKPSYTKIGMHHYGVI